MPTGLEDTALLFEKNLSAVQKDDFNAMTNVKMLLGSIICALHAGICLSVLSCRKLHIVSHENDTVQLKSFFGIFDCSKWRDVS